ncbi:hypothetical protein AGDE_14480 [Angomonas deanei]|uniref:Uncharacterized protein n=1 Tax=Angomonas deanei TaxID=59799 RepID=A0A7G2CQG1_9TRYP|nr:hypothetical protein AGDE_14480 [Angomonas deanei]CAD2220412.1 hypothetical protein, conserved [Angomonas deanei]|eukprot:EPY20731.1 hypothetical protein AGDE_14480 [Angomonas deanei]
MTSQDELETLREENARLQSELEECREQLKAEREKHQQEVSALQQEVIERGRRTITLQTTLREWDSNHKDRLAEERERIRLEYKEKLELLKKFHQTEKESLQSEIQSMREITGSLVTGLDTNELTNRVERLEKAVTSDRFVL